MPRSQLATLFMKVDANSDGAVSWEEFSSFILEAGNVSEANSSKQSGGSLLEGPFPRPKHPPVTATHTSTITLVALHIKAHRFATCAPEAQPCAPTQEVKGRGGGAGARGPGMDICRATHQVPERATIKLWNQGGVSHGAARGKSLGAPTLTSTILSGPQATVLAMSFLTSKFELRSRSHEYILAVASADGVIRFYDLEKLNLQAQMVCKGCVCTTLMTFSILPPGIGV